MTSPEIIDKTKSIISLVVITYPEILNPSLSSDEKIYLIQSVTAYRVGLGSKQEIGIALNGIWTPGLVV